MAGSSPLVFTPTTPRALLLGAQVLFRSLDLGVTWKVISPDLTGMMPGARGCDGRVAGENARACGFGVISTIAPSPTSADLIWVGTDSGLIQVTRDGGGHWRNVTPPTLEPWEKVSAISPSALDPKTAYAAVNDQRRDDFRPHVFRTHDYGRTWTEIDAGLPSGRPVSVVRADPVRAGLLFCGTTQGVFVSFDDGARWQSLRLNLPHAWINDLLIHDNDLIAATQGRSIWVLDDVTPLRQVSSAVLGAPAHLFTPEAAWRVHPDNNRDTPLPPETPQGQNPPAGAVIDYWLGPDASGPVSLAIYDLKGTLVRRFSSDEKPQAIDADRYFAKGWLKAPEMLSGSPGMHRFVWNLRYSRPQAISYDYSLAAVFGEDTPTSVDGPFVLPGLYTVVLTADGRQYKAPLRVRLDPRVHAQPAELRALLSFSEAAGEALTRCKSIYDAENPAHQALAKLETSIAAGQGPRQLLPLVKRLSDATASDGRQGVVSLSGQISALESNTEAADMAPTAAQWAVLAAAEHSVDRAARVWQTSETRIQSLNRALLRAHLPAVL